MSELQHSTHSTQTTRRKRGRDVQKGGVGEEFANIVPEEEKLGTIKGEKKRGKKGHREEKRGEKRQRYQQFHLELSWFHYTPYIDCFQQLQLNIKPLLSKKEEGLKRRGNIVLLRQMTRTRRQMKRRKRWETAGDL